MDAIMPSLASVWEEAVAIWYQGGWAMIAIAIIALVMFGVGMSIHLKLRAKGFLSVSEERWRLWMKHPDERRGPVGALLDELDGVRTVKQATEVFERVHLKEVTPFTRDLMVMKICVSAAPLVGLLGTVTGMLTTFGALSGGGGGDETMTMVAGGISEALITTETGLVIALPGLFFQYQLVRKHERYKAFLAHLETVVTQAIYRADRAPSRAEVRRQAQAEVAARIRERMQVSAASPNPS